MPQEKYRSPMEQVKDRAEETVKEFSNIVWKISCLHTQISMRVKNCFRLILDHLVPPHKTTDAKELEWVEYGALASVYFLPGEDPVAIYCSMTPKEREQALKEMASFYCRKMEINPHQLALMELPPDVPGGYEYTESFVCLNKDLVESHSMTREKAEMAIMTLFHELFHAYQNAAMYQPNKYGIPKEVAADWRHNRKDYCPPDKNPVRYKLQPLEASAIWISGEVMKRLRDPEYVQWVLNNFVTGGK